MVFDILLLQLQDDIMVLDSVPEQVMLTSADKWPECPEHLSNRLTYGELQEGTCSLCRQRKCFKDTTKLSLN